MNKNRLLTLVLLTFISILSITAKIVSQAEALKIAQKYVRTVVPLKSLPNNSRFTQVSKPYYIYNDRWGKGFVIVSGNDAMGEILGYSHTGTLDTLTASPELRFLLSQYAESYNLLKANKRIVKPIYKKNNRAVVPPLLKSTWNQTYPYNYKTGYEYTGCVATAMAQIMYYHKWPNNGKGNNSYIVNNDGKRISIDFSKSTYKWNLMLPSYSDNNYSSENRDAVAYLMRDVGASMNMQYTPNASSTSSAIAAKALTKYFDYSTSLINKSDEGTAQFMEIIRKELENGFPVYISGFTRGLSGHAWVTDGVDENDFFHMNFGWGGQADGYFSLSSINLSNTGNEFSGRPLNFSSRLHIIIVHPNKPNTKPIDESLVENAPNIAFNISGNMRIIGNKPSKVEDEVEVAYSNFTNISSTSFAGDIGTGIYSEEGKLLKIFPSKYHDNGGYIYERFKLNEHKMPSGGLLEDEQIFKIDFSKLSNGNYFIYPICARINDDNKYDSWCKMKRAPRIGFEINDKKVRIFELPDNEKPFQLQEHPFVESPIVGAKTNLRLVIRQLVGLSYDGYIKVSFIDEAGDIAQVIKSKSVISFEQFAEKRFRIPILLDKDLKPGRYKLKIEIEDDRDPTHSTEVIKVYGKEDSYIDIKGSTPNTKIFKKILGFVTDNSGSSIQSTDIDIVRNSLIKIGIVFSLGDNKKYVGTMTMALEDTQDGRIIPVNSGIQKFNITDNKNYSFISGWIKTNELDIINNRLYKLRITGNSDGKEQVLWDDPIEISFIHAKNDVYPNKPTGINANKDNNYLLTIEGNSLIISGNKIRQVDVYTVEGRLIEHYYSKGEDTIKLPIQYNGFFIVKVKGVTNKVFKIFK